MLLESTHTVIDEVKQALQQHPCGHLERGHRHRIGNSFEHESEETTHRFVCILSLIVVTKIIDNWLPLIPDHGDYPLDVFEMTKRHVFDGETIPNPKMHVDKLCVYSDDLIYYYSEKYKDIRIVLSRAVALCLSIASCLNDTLMHDSASTSILETHNEQGNLLVDDDPWEFDTAVHASISYTGKGIWTADSRDKRIEFWLWWLDEAIPLAWDVRNKS